MPSSYQHNARKKKQQGLNEEIGGRGALKEFNVAPHLPDHGYPAGQIRQRKQYSGHHNTRIPFGHAPGLFPWRGLPGQNRTMLAIAIQIFRERLDRAIPPSGVFLKGGQEDRIKVAFKLPPVVDCGGARLDRLHFVDDPRHLVQSCGFQLVRASTGKQFIKHYAQRVDIRQRRERTYRSPARDWRTPGSSCAPR